LRKHYQQLIEQEVLCEDKAQSNAVDELEKLSKQLLSKQLIATKKNEPIISGNLFSHYISKKTQPKATSPIKSLYFYGRVGRGKTMLMDLFYQYTPIKKKKRIHFHRFMENVHQQLNELSMQQSLQKTRLDKNPLTHIANTWATDLQLLCFDEFFVSDIGDAMLLAGLFETLFSQGVILVFTSNCQPEQLYRNGLQRERFVPTIALINHYCQVISIDGDTDHRLTNTVNQAYKNYYFTHLQGETLLANRFQGLRERTTPHIDEDKKNVIVVNNREINYLAKTSNHIWFDFYALCSGPRSQRDYIQIADEFDTVLISNVPQFAGDLIPAVFSGIEDCYQRSGVLMGELRHLDDEARRFIALVDEFYDSKVQLIISADVDITQLYQGTQLSFEFQRCQSRLFEMQNF
jgi:cell division protein ZapE